VVCLGNKSWKEEEEVKKLQRIENKEMKIIWSRRGRRG